MEARKPAASRYLTTLAAVIAAVAIALALAAAMPAKAFATQSKSGNFYSASLSGNGASDMVAVAQAQNSRSQSSMGYTEGWCADFVSDCAKIAGQSDAIPFNGGVSNLYNAIINAGGTVVSSPQKGDIAFFGNYAHVGIMVDSTYCISGNMDSSYVRTYRYSAMSPSIKCFVRPNYKATTPSLTEVSVAEGYYTIRSKVGSGAQFLDVSNGTDENLANLQTYEAEDNRAQTFYVRWCSEHGGYIITMLNSSRMLDTYNNGETGNVHLYDHTGANGQHWKFYDAGDGCRYIMNLNGGYLDVGDGICANSTNVSAWYLNQSDAQKWMLAGHSGVTKKTDVEAGCYTLKSAAGNVVLDIAGGAKGGNAQVYQPVNNTNQLFQVYKNATGGGYAFQCVTIGENWLGTAGNTCGAGANVLDQAGDGSYGQNWFIEDAGGGYVYIRNKWGYYLDVYCGGTLDGTNVRVWDFNGSNAQKWKLVKSSGKGATAVASDSYLIRSAADSSLALSAAGDGTTNDENIQLASASSCATQVFAVGNKTDLAIKEANVNYRYLDLAATGKRIVGYTNANGPTNAILYSGTSENNNCWAFEDAGGGLYYIRDRWGYYLTAASVETGGNVATAGFTGADNQKWQLDPAIDWAAYAKSVSAASAAKHGTNDYERFDVNVGWDEAKAICEALGGHLVAITDADEQAAVQSLVSGAYNIYAIGCTDAEEEGAWRWVTGEELSYSNWDPQAPEPNNGTAANYGFMVGVDYGENKQVGEWIDEPEHTSNQTFYNVAGAGFVCEYEGLDVSVANRLARIGAKAAFACTAHGRNATQLSYQWQCSADGGATWADWADGGSSDELSVQLTADRAGWLFRCTASTPDGRSATSDAVGFEVALDDGCSRWIPADEVPADATVTDEKWTYTSVETAESTDPALEGYTQTGSRWSKTGSGTNYYAVLPSGFSTGDSIYAKYSNAALSAYETDSAKRTVSTSWNSYVYWHWTCNKYEIASGNYNVLIEDAYRWVNSKEYYNFRAFESTSDASHYDPNGVNGGDCYYYWRSIVEDGSWWWFRFDTYKQSYADYEKVYSYERETPGCESATEVAEGDDVRDVEHLVRYTYDDVVAPLTATASTAAVPLGATGTLSCEVEGAVGAGLTYQWQYSKDGGATWKDAYANDSAATANFTVDVTAARASYLWRCAVAASDGRTATTDAIQFQVTAAPTATASTTPVALGATAKLTCEVSGNTGTPAYQWQYRTSSTGSWKSATATGNKTATLSAALTAARLGYDYRCKVTVDGQTIYTDPIRFQQAAGEELTATASTEAISAIGDKGTLSCAVEGLGSATATYQWQYRASSTAAWADATANASAKTADFTVTVNAARAANEWRCVVTASDGRTATTDVVRFQVG